ncbi:hypothetical protein AMTRI_Chr03g43520 [Amborella trichopoda]|uniref:Protein kinase domain-containing protein n=1 Tax=Amborella trichopoda TaxID=13333 RepID=W1PUN8_AMBTC|nr:probable L-type lectin-domain containing receptor kinase S.5 [Amborella trichopoda]ERN11421.1 hypothetical protein AMTR_s00022p00037460 [Amborella trichopoda]|eukprot:XP_006849840.1 probable L-type lectin-domain containing receptor kinase S.5 [Amborella trichopoda]
MASAEKLILFSLFLVTHVYLSHAYPLITMSYPNFNEANRGDFQFENNATINNGALQVTPDTVNSDYSLTHKSARVVLKSRFRLWDQSSTGEKTMASFNSTFVFNTYRQPNVTVGEGLAFAILPDFTVPENSSGQWLGLTNSSIDGNASNHFFAIEFDTVKDSFDPDDNHVGLDLNSVISNKTFSLSKMALNLTPPDGINYRAWVEYNASSMLLNVFIEREKETQKPDNPILSEIVDLSNYVEKVSHFGFSASTGDGAQLNCVVKWDLSVEKLPEDDQYPWLRLVLAIGVPIFAVISVVGITVGVFVYRRRNKEYRNLHENLRSLPGTPREFRFSDLKRATDNFSEKMKLGQGGFGTVYKGTLKKENMVVAVKKFSREAIQGRDDFLAELSVINRLRHRNLVRLLGWCYKQGELLLVYAYMPNGSLDKHLFDGESCLEWERRYSILAGVASALHYLHNEYDQKVVHRDLKASNIMLDSDYNARLGDFGLARVLDQEKTSYAELNGVPGTLGYIAPECFHTGKATRESDVFGFGAVVLEVVCGRRPNSANKGFLVDLVWALYREGRILEAIDPQLEGQYNEDDAQRLLLLGLACSHPSPIERPKTENIVQIMARTVAPPYVPPFRPPFVWHMGSSNDCSSVDTTKTQGTYSGWSPVYLSQDSYGSQNDSVV